LYVIHLAFEDHRRPGSGGGSLRNHRINAELARRHHVTALVSRYPGARRRIEDGIEYRPIGLRFGHMGSMMSYHLAVPLYVLRHRADLVIEDFAAPHSADLVPLWTGCPTIAIVQYLFAEEKTRQYRVPFWFIENLGVALHKRFVAVSEHVRGELQRVNPSADIDVVYAGVEPPKTLQYGPRRDMLFLGRFEFDMKGLDTLVDILATVRREMPDVRLRIAGNGPHEPRLRELLEARGLSPAVDWLGRVDGELKWQTLASASVVLMPSRYETFGLVALESLSVGTPVVGSAIPTFVEIAGTSQSMFLAPIGDAAGMSSAVIELMRDDARWKRMSQAGRNRALEFSWSAAVAEHERIYVEAARAPYRSWVARIKSIGAAVRLAKVRVRGPK